MCHADRAPGSNVTSEPDVRDGAFTLNKGSMRTEPVKYSAGAFAEGWEPLRATLTNCEPGTEVAGAALDVDAPPT